MSHQRLAKRSLDQDLFEEVQTHMQGTAFLERASERMWKCEGLFAEAKQNHCLARSKYRGRLKVQIQAYFTAIMRNLKRLLFPLYCRLLAHRWPYSTSTAPAWPSNRSCPTKKPFALFQQAPPFLSRLRKLPVGYGVAPGTDPVALRQCRYFRKPYPR
jgi:hypothetical protein